MARDVADSAVSGAIAALGAALAFLTFHAIVIVPVWWSATSEVWMALVCGATIGAAFHFFPRRPLLLGLFLWGAFAITSLVMQSMRAALRTPEWLEVTVAILGAAAYGAAIGWRLHGKPGAIAGTIASLAMLAVSGGPLTRTSPRALTIGLSLLPVACLYAAAYAAVLRVVALRRVLPSPRVLPPPA